MVEQSDLWTHLAAVLIGLLPGLIYARHVEKKHPTTDIHHGRAHDKAR